jgi:hypothetical protein
MNDRDVDELHRLWNLKEKGAISEEEYVRLKDKILGQEIASASATNEHPSDAPLPGTDVEFRNKADGVGGRQAVGIGCAVIAALVIVAAIGSSGSNKPSTTALNLDENLTTTDMNLAAPDKNLATPDMKATAPKTAYTSGKNQIEEDVGLGSLTSVQANAARSAEQYLSMTGFSRDGLIQQLSSSAGEGYSVADATAAVDSLTVDWNENASKSARQYLDMSGFSCSGLIEQLSSRAGDKYTVEQATYGARQAGAC